MTSYASQSDLYSFGLTRGSLVNPGRVAQVNATLNAFILDEHGFSANDPVSFRPDAGGVLPTPIVAHTGYFAIVLSSGLFQVASTSGGSALDLGSGNDVVVIAELPIDAAIEWASRIIDDMMPAHVVPFEADAIPDIVRMTCAELAAGKLSKGATSAALMATVDAAQMRLARWAKGVPVRGASRPANLSVAATATALDPTGWKTHGGL